MKIIDSWIFSAAIVLCAFSSADVLADPKRTAEQLKLDQQCEQARQIKLQPIRKKLIQDCKIKKDDKACDAEFANYGERVGVKVPLFYDLPECEKAAEHLRSYRQSSQ